MKKMIQMFLITLISLTSFADTGWSGRLLENEQFNDEVRKHIVQTYKNKCGTSHKDFELPPVILISAKESSLGFTGNEIPSFTVTLRTFSTEVSEYVEQNFDINVRYNSLLDRFNFKFEEEFEMECVD